MRLHSHRRSQFCRKATIWEALAANDKMGKRNGRSHQGPEEAAPGALQSVLGRCMSKHGG